MLGELEASDVIDPLISVLSDSVSRIRNAAFDSSEEICSEKAVEYLLTFLEKNKETGSRGFIYCTLDKIESEENRPVLISGLNDFIRYNRVATLNALYQINAQKSDEYVIRAMEDH
jgi:HEAT repeat protein